MIKISKILVWIPNVGILVPYFYAFVANVLNKSDNSFKSVDPKNIIENLYGILHLIPGIGILTIPICIVIFVVAKYKEHVIPPSHTITLTVGVLLNMLLYYFDPGEILFWFFD